MPGEVIMQDDPLLVTKEGEKVDPNHVAMNMIEN